MKLTIIRKDINISDTSLANCAIANALRRTFSTSDAWVSNDACGIGDMVFALEGHALEVANKFAAGREITPTVIDLRQVYGPKVLDN